MPCFRHSSAADSPAWCSFSTPMICSSVSRLFLIVRLLATDSSSERGHPRGQGQHPYAEAHLRADPGELRLDLNGIVRLPIRRDPTDGLHRRRGGRDGLRLLLRVRDLDLTAQRSDVRLWASCRWPGPASGLSARAFRPTASTALNSLVDVDCDG